MTKSQAKLRNLSFSAAIFGSKMAATTEMALDDLKKADEIISMAVLGSKTEIAPKPPQNGRKFWSTLSLTGGGVTRGNKKKKPPQRQYSNAFPCPLNVRSIDLDSPPDGSTLGLVHSAPFASMAMTSVHAKRARKAFRGTRTVHSDQNNEVGTFCNFRKLSDKCH